MYVKTQILIRTTSKYVDPKKKYKKQTNVNIEISDYIASVWRECELKGAQMTKKKRTTTQLIHLEHMCISYKHTYVHM